MNLFPISLFVFLLGMSSSTSSQPQPPSSQSKSLPRDRLQDAVFIGDVTMVKKLLLEFDEGILISGELEVDVNRRDAWYGRTPLMNCGWDPQGHDSNGDDEDTNCLEIGKMLVARGANVSAIDDNGWDAVGLGVVKGLAKYVSYLIVTCGAPANRLNGVEDSAMTPLQIASGIGSIRVFDAVFQIVSRQQLWMEKTPQGLGILHIATRYAATSSNTSSSILFLKHIVKQVVYGLGLYGINGNLDDLNMFRDKDNRTPLMYASLFRCIECARVLMRVGFSPYAIDNFGVNAFQTHLDMKISMQNIYIEEIEYRHSNFLSETSADQQQRHHDHHEF